MPHLLHPGAVSRPARLSAAAAVITALIAGVAAPARAVTVTVLDSTAFAYVRDVKGEVTEASDTAANPSAVIPRFQAAITSGSATATSSISVLSDPSTSTMRIYAQGSDTGVNTTIDAEAYFTKTILVDSKTLATGDPARVRFDFKLDGLSAVIPNSLGVRSFGSVESFASWRLTDPAIQICDEGCRPAVLARFGYDGRLLVDTGFNDRTWKAGWDAESNVTAGLGAVENLAGVNSARTFIPPFSLYVDTFVGRTLDIRATMEVFAQMTLPSSVLGNFRNTFDVEAASETPGVFILGEQPGLSTVSDGAPPIPEPGTWAMMLAGIAALAGMRARRR